MTSIFDIKQCGWSDVLQVCVHLQVVSCTLPFIQVENVVVTNSQTLVASSVVSYTHIFVLIFTQCEDEEKELHRTLLIPPYHSSCSLMYYHKLLLREGKTNSLKQYGIAKKYIEQVKYEEPITLIIKTDNRFVHLRSLKFVKPLVKFIFKTQGWFTGQSMDQVHEGVLSVRSTGVFRALGVHVLCTSD